MNICFKLNLCLAASKRPYANTNTNKKGAPYNRLSGPAGHVGGHDASPQAAEVTERTHEPGSLHSSKVKTQSDLDFMTCKLWDPTILTLRLFVGDRVKKT